MRAELVLDCRNHHGEGVLWNQAESRVWWTDIEGRALWSYDPLTGSSECREMGERVCCFAPRRDGGLIVAYADRVALLDDQSGSEEIIVRFEPENENTRLNDGRTDRQGRLIVGGMNEGTGAADSSVLSIDTDLSVRTVVRGVSCANSTCFSPDGGTMYFADTPDREVVAFDYDGETGKLSNRRRHASFEDEPGLPDGSCVDAEGGVWNAEWEGRRVVRIAPNGVIDQVIDVPVWKPTCCAFGGPNLDTLFITTSRLMSDDDVLSNEPESGGLFAIQPGVRGVLDAPFNG
jgi:L-arabinonolactonase